MAKDNQFEKDFYARVKKENGRLEKNENGTLLLIHSNGGEFTPELLIDFAKCNQDSLKMVFGKDRSNIVNYILSDNQKKQIEGFWHSSAPDANDLNVITRLITGRKDADGRCREGRSIRQFLASKEFNYKTIKQEVLPEYVLTVEQKEFIKKHYTSLEPHKISRKWFNNPELQILSLETRAFEKYFFSLQNEYMQNSLSPESADLDCVTEKDLKNQKLETYRPPGPIDQVVYRINKYVNPNPEWNSKALKKEQMQCCASLKKYLWTYSFVNYVNTYKTQEDRDLFEDGFVRYCYDKINLTNEEMDQFILLCAQKVYQLDLQRQLEELRLQQKEARDKGDKTISQTAFTEAVNALQSERKNAIDHAQKLLDKLTKSRKERLDSQLEQNATVLNLVNAWRDEEQRLEMIALGDYERQEVEEEVVKLSNIEALQALIRGIDPSELYD